ncbi:ribosomal RNA processing protein 1 homolog B-like isoform X1 [Thunnus albacares]|uniref:ribosomal RNA processing protein 1 homolog B-like isoform X1 n=1 Tax=Thunnus albacares TaxID=8236 RepID=UPI001CF71C78|nr:ribosomal RNA processing protein 1 homolog B-like isoform X1 [Thunnus albacares]
MASIQEPEVQFAQRLASNEKPIRSKAMKKLRKYINVRSQKAAGGFTADELLKLWKGLFYCLWMQDKPLLQEELSNMISSLIHSFHSIDAQFLYLESFLQTFKREWTGIDRLRMDKFFQLVRFMFRQTFEILKRKDWESSAVGRFLELLTVQLLQSDSGAPSGLQFHILDLYMTELAALGSAELDADQNLRFIEPFCKTAAKTKDRTLFRAICSSIFSAIIDQAPYAIEDLMKELKAAEASDSGQASEEEEEEDEEDEDQLKEKTTSKLVGKKGAGKQINGRKSHEEDDDDDDDDDEDEDDFLHLEDSDTELPCDDDMGPVLQFDYAALADKLFALASRSSTPSYNRQRLYKIIKVLRDLSEGVFPQDEYPDEVSTDEDDDMFGSRKRMKRGGGHTEEDEEEEGAPAAKKRKGKKKEALKRSKDSGKDDSEAADATSNDDDKKKKRKKKKKKKAGQAGEQTAAVTQSTNKETEAQTQNSVSSVKVTEAATPDGQSETLLLVEAKKQPAVTVTEPEMSSDADTEKKKKKKKKDLKAEKKMEETEAEITSVGSTVKETEAGSQADDLEKEAQTQNSISTVKVTEAATPDGQSETLLLLEVKKQPAVTVTDEDQSETLSKKKKKRQTSELKPEAAGEQQTAVTQEVAATAGTPEPEMSSDADVAASGKKKKKKKKGLEAESQVNAEAETEATTPAKRKKKGLKAEKKTEEAEAGSQVTTDSEITPVGEEASQDTVAVPLKKKTKKKSMQAVETDQTPEDTTLESSAAADQSAATPLKKKRKKNLKESKSAAPVGGEEEEEEAAAAVTETPQVAEEEEKLLLDITTTTPTRKKKKSQKQAAGGVDEEDEAEAAPSSGKPTKKKRKIPVTFEYEADEMEAATSINGLAEEAADVEEPFTPLSTKKSQKEAKTSSGSDFVSFQNKAAVPTPLFCRTKGSPATPLSKKKKKSQTPKSESKKVTFGLKNNKTAEFRKTDRSLLVSPDGSSRVPFDPQQKPKCGVLKSPPTLRSASVKNTPNRKKSLTTPKSTPKRRPSAADFF